ncbi:MAG: hypothetical protein KAX24_02525 [Anaerolineae bacterium]|nr:hypothetical protein [Anaerolineae bacterium]
MAEPLLPSGVPQRGPGTGPWQLPLACRDPDLVLPRDAPRFEEVMKQSVIT